MESVEFIRLLANSNLTWAAALAIMSVVLRGVLLVLATGLVDARKAATKAMEERNENEKEQTRVLAEVRDTLKDTGIITQSVLSLLQPVSQLPEKLDTIKDQMITRTQAQDEMVRNQGEKINQIQLAIQNLPDTNLVKTAAHFDPTLKNIQNAIELLRSQLESQPLTVQDVKEIRSELGQILKILKEKQSGRDI